PSSMAALRVKVRPRTSAGSTSPLATSQTTRAAIVSVLPDPAPATTRWASGGASMTAACCGVGGGVPTAWARSAADQRTVVVVTAAPAPRAGAGRSAGRGRCGTRSEEHTSELQSRENLVCRLLLEKKKKKTKTSK